MNVLSGPQAAPLAHAGAISELARVIVALLLVLAAVLLLARLMRWARGAGTRGRELLDVMADLPLGQKERAVLVRLGRTQILLGVAPGRVNTLHVLPEPLELPGAGPSAPLAGPSTSFAALLRRSLGR